MKHTGNVALSAVVAGLLWCAPASADLITVEWEITVRTDGSPPFVGLGTLIFDNTVTGVDDHGTPTAPSVFTFFGTKETTRWISPVGALIAPDPYGGGVQNANRFVMGAYGGEGAGGEVLYKSSAYNVSPDGQHVWTYDVEVRAGGSADRPGPTTGPRNSAEVLAWYREFALAGYAARWYENYGLDGEGQIWGGEARIISISEEPVSVPEPSTLCLLMVAAFAVGIKSYGRRTAATRRTFGQPDPEPVLQVGSCPGP